MRCVLCEQHATFTQTVFQGASPTTVNLCPECAQKVHAEELVASIKGAPDKDAKSTAVAQFLKAVGK